MFQYNYQSYAHYTHYHNWWYNTRDWCLHFPVIFSSRELSSMKRRSVTHYSSFIDDNSRLEKKTGKRIRHATRGHRWLVSRPLFKDLLTLHDEIFCSKKCLGALLGDRRANRPLRACRFWRELLAMQGRTFMMLHSEFWRGLVVSFGRYWQKEFCSLIFISNRYPPP